MSVALKLRLIEIVVVVGAALAVTGLFVPHGALLTAAGFCFVLGGFLAVLAVRRIVRGETR